MTIETEYMSFKNHWTISRRYDLKAHQQRSQRICCFSQAALLRFEVLWDLPLALRVVSPSLTDDSRFVVSALRLVAGAPSYSEGRQECPSRVWYSADIDAVKFTFHLLTDTPGGFQWGKYILLTLYSFPTHHQHLLSSGWLIWFRNTPVGTGPDFSR